MAAELNPRQHRFVEEQLTLLKLGALHQLGRMLGMFRPADVGGMQKRRVEFGDAEVLALCSVVVDPDAHPIKRTACAYVLDYLFPHWRCGLDPQIAGLVVRRSDNAVHAWRKAVLTRDGGACVECGALDRPEAHHLVSWADAPWLRLVLSNGVTLCHDHHMARHYG